MASGRSREAGQAFAAAYRADSTRVELLYSLAMSQDAQGDSTGAAETYRLFLASWRGGENAFVARVRARLRGIPRED
jgi:cytochrome c-type biogenesis protein CcmH/NrfG